MRSEISFRVHWKGLAAVAFAGAIMLALPNIATAQQVVAFVNGQPITVLDIEHRSKFLQMSNKKVPSRKEVMDSLIDEILEITEAKRYGLDIPDEQVNKSYNTVATRMGLDGPKLTQLLTAGGASDDTLKRRLKAQMAWTNLVRGRYKASLEIRDKDVEAQLQLHKTDKKKRSRLRVHHVGRWSSSSRAVRPMRHSRRANARPRRCVRASRIAAKASRSRARCRKSPYAIKFRSFPPTCRSNCGDILDGTAVGHLTPPERRPRGCRCSPYAPRRRPSPTRRRCGRFAIRSSSRNSARRPSAISTICAAGAMIEYKSVRRQEVDEIRKRTVLPLALTLGEPAGIGPDLAVAVWRRRARTRSSAILLVADPRISSRRRAERLSLDVPIATVTPAAAAAAFPSRLPVVGLDIAVSAEPGRPDRSSAPAAIASLRRAVADVFSGAAAAVVTNPMAKNVLYKWGFAEPGQTEFLATLAQETTGKWRGRS